MSNRDLPLLKDALRKTIHLPEYRAMEAVIRAAQKGGPYVSVESDIRMGRALARLDRVRGAKRGGGR